MFGHAKSADLERAEGITSGSSCVPRASLTGDPRRCWLAGVVSDLVSGGFTCSPDGIRTRATALRGRRARPLHNGALAYDHQIDQTAEAYQLPLPSSESPSFCVAGVLGLEPRLTEPESVGLPITLYPTGVAPGRRT